MNKKLFNLPLILFVFLFTNCKKETTPPTDPTPTVQKDYAPVSAGSTFTYTDTTNDLVSSITLTATANNIIRFGKSFTTFNSSGGSNFYISKSGAKYFNISTYPAMASGIFENTYLIDSLPENATWTVPFKIYNILGLPDSLNAVATYKISEKGITRAVNNNLFTNVIHVELTDVSAYSDTPPAGLMASGIAHGHYYYALGVGLIQSKFEIEDIPSYGIGSYKSSQILTSYSIK